MRGVSPGPRGIALRMQSTTVARARMQSSATDCKSKPAIRGLLLIMYGPPPDCKSRVVGRRVSLRKCIRPLVGDASPGHDDDAHVPVLINRSVTENQLNSQVLRHVV